jgi:hypothetical protein
MELLTRKYYTNFRPSAYILNYHVNDNEAFKGCHTHGQERAFIRNRVLPFLHLIISILRMRAPEAFMELNDIVWRGFYKTYPIGICYDLDITKFT